ncbi:hypothetical protein L596_010501 [Steinernema carpocapsae]|uniref:Uncharacterized protein n=1 Tax=Steinernema carpocapsae TaxID=34508 RepID=A0A4U5PJ90_STECR|nr:hypothetical protein L596_010501 [Steinernema carpocapsae]
MFGYEHKRLRSAVSVPHINSIPIQTKLALFKKLQCFRHLTIMTQPAFTLFGLDFHSEASSQMNNSLEPVLKWPR